jgi:hypothetical protein
MGGKANCLCSRGIWETPKPRYREETKPVRKVAWGHFRATFGLGTPRACHRQTWRAERGAEGPSEETHPLERVEESFAEFLGPAFVYPAPLIQAKSPRSRTTSLGSGPNSLSC